MIVPYHMFSLFAEIYFCRKIMYRPVFPFYSICAFGVPFVKTVEYESPRSDLERSNSLLYPIHAPEMLFAKINKIRLALRDGPKTGNCLICKNT